jgi:threonine dehydrogenase-like Zn-dependent dehydrogenase
LSDEKVLFLSDIFPTGYMAAENAEIEAGDTVAVWGCGPVGQFAIRSAWMLGAGRVIAIDSVEERLSLASKCSAETINFENEDVYERLLDMTMERGPDRCIDAVGCEAHGAGTFERVIDGAAEKVGLTPNRMYALTQAIMCCRKGGTVSIPGVYTGAATAIPMGAAMNKGLTLKMGQTHMQRYLAPLLEKIEEGAIDPSFVITDRIELEDAPEAYQTFNKKEDGCIKVVLTP